MQVSIGNGFDGPNGFEHIHDTLVNVCGQARDALEQPACMGMGWVQPGWVQVRFSHLMTSREVDFIIRAVMEVGQDGWKLLPQYDCSVSTGTLLSAALAQLLSFRARPQSSSPAREIL
ncbi:MAG: hypothetical protein HC767_06620 [Akkermansiaceae bacterium]|nr:hypothetical protein [Akkermansiaceae bacterium]